MARITKFDRPTLRLLGDDIKQALDAVAKRHGLLLTMKGGRYDDFSYTPRMAFAVSGEGGADKSAENDWNQWRALYGMAEVPFGASFTNTHGTYSICGIKPRGQKYTVLGKRTDGKVYKFKHQDVARWIGTKGVDRNAEAEASEALRRTMARINGGRGLGGLDAETRAEMAAEARAAKAEARWEARNS
jgi:hypothetical protein